MAEDKINPEIQSSQDGTVHSSQETEILNLLFKNFSESSLFTSVMNLSDLDSANINEVSQEHLLTIEPGMLHGEIASSDNVTVSSVLPTQIPTVGSNAQSSSLPACETWAGRYNFNVSFSAQNKSTKGVAWTYSPIKDKLYVGKDAPCPINFSANTVLPSDVYIRVMALYTSPEQVSEIVQRCVNHSMDEIKNGRFEAQHLIRCESSTATYHADAAGRHSVLVPFENPPAGQKYSTYIYKFACFGSCAGGPNRRPLMLIFTLESGGQVIGRRKLDVKICACPGRDRKNEETQCAPAEEVNPPIHSPIKRKLPSECVALSEVMAFTKTIYAPLPKKKKTMPNKDGLFNLSGRTKEFGYRRKRIIEAYEQGWENASFYSPLASEFSVRTDDRELYDFLRQMKKFYEMCKTVKNLSPDILNMALQHIQKVKTERKD